MANALLNMCWTLLLLDSRIHTSLLAVNARRWLASWSSETHRGQKHHDRKVVERSRCRMVWSDSASAQARKPSRTTRIACMHGYLQEMAALYVPCARCQIQLTSADVHIRRDKDCLPAQVTSPHGPSPAFVPVVMLSSSGNIAAKVPALLIP